MPELMTNGAILIFLWSPSIAGGPTSLTVDHALRNT
jgi:hypothetical protein